MDTVKAERFRLYKEEVANGAEITIETLREDLDPEDYFASGDDVADKELTDQIRADLAWNPWAWCVVKVTARYADIESSEYLGACSYEDEREFKDGGYFEDMKDTAITELTHRVMQIVDKFDKEGASI